VQQGRRQRDHDYRTSTTGIGGLGDHRFTPADVQGLTKADGSTSSAIIGETIELDLACG
jgi:hypothetical protein